VESRYSLQKIFSPKRSARVWGTTNLLIIGCRGFFPSWRSGQVESWTIDFPLAPALEIIIIIIIIIITIITIIIINCNWVVTRRKWLFYM